MNPLELKKTRVVLHDDHVSNVHSIDFPHNFPNEDLSWDFETFKRNFDIVITRQGEHDIEFDLIGIDASIVNAFRRILIAEVPTMAIEKVFIMDNSSVMADEVLAQRLGLIPIFVDAREFDYRNGPDDPPTDLNTIVFKLEVECEHNPKANSRSLHPKDRFINSNVLSSHLEWQPQGDQADKYDSVPIGPAQKDILIVKLRPGQRIEAELHAEKGIGKTHAKWSPVATASYRLLSDIQILKPILNEEAHKFVKCFPQGVIGIRKDNNGNDEAYVMNPRKDTVSRECYRHAEFKDKVLLTRVRDHFLFNIESTGTLPSEVLFMESIQIMMDKCRIVKESLITMGYAPTYTT